MTGLSASNSADDTFDRDYDFASGARMQFDVKNVTDSGLEYGARIRFNNVAPGLNSFTELVYENNEFRTGQDYEATALTSGVVLSF